MIIFIIVFVLMMFVAALIVTDSQKQKVSNKLSIESIMNNPSDFSSTQKFISENYSTGIEIDENGKKIRLFYLTKKNDTDKNFIDSKVYGFEEVVESEIIVDNESITRASRSGQIGGVLIGSALAGGVGAIIGGLSSKQSGRNTIRSIDLKLTIGDMSKPIYKINFLNSIDEISGNQRKVGELKTSKKCQEALEKVDHWHGLMGLILKDSELNKKSSV